MVKFSKRMNLMFDMKSTFRKMRDFYYMEKMKTKLFYVWRSISSNFWFIPVLMVLLAVGLSIIMQEIDKRVWIQSYPFFDLLYAGDPEGARSVLTTVASSMITVAGVVFSLTMVVLTLASSQFGPRLLRNFMSDRGNQIVLGTFVATFIYCLLILQTIKTTGEEVFAPSISVSFAIVLAMVNIGVFIYFIHHISTSIQADRIVAKVFGELEKDLQRLFPEGRKCMVDEKKQRELLQIFENVKNESGLTTIAPKSGYLRTIAEDSLLEIAKQNELILHVQYHPGEFIVAGGSLVIAYGAKDFEEETSEQIIACFRLGSQRTPDQDPEFAIHQLVEVALRALSPGINDPFTAITCIDYLGAALCYLIHKEFPTQFHCDDEGKLRLIMQPTNFTGMLNAAFDQIRQYGQTSVAVTIHLLEVLKTIAAQARSTEQYQSILRQAEMIKRMSETALYEKLDKKDVKNRYLDLLEVLGEL